MSPEASVIIPHYDDLPRLRTCLAALAPQAEGRPVEILVVDNGSPGDVAATVAAFRGVALFCEPQQGAAPARNRGAAESRGARLLFLDADCVPAPDWLAVALALPDEDAVWGGAVEIFDETPPPRSGAEAFETVFAFPQRDYVESKGFSVTANLATTRVVFERTGGFRPGLAEDVDWCRRARAAGFAIRYAGALRVGHPSRGDWPALVRKWRRITDEGFGLWGRSPARRVTWALRALLVAASGPVHVPRVLGSARLGRGEKLRGAGTLIALRSLRAVWMLRQAVTGRCIRS